MRFISFLLVFISLKASAAINLTPPFEQGSWTPIFFLSTSQPSTVTYSQQNGYYTKFGNMVCVTAYVALSAFTAGSGAGNAYVSGTPFATTTTVSGGGVVVLSKANFSPTGPDAAQSLADGSNAFELLAFSAGGVSNVVRSSMSPTSTVSLQGCYITKQ